MKLHPIRALAFALALPLVLLLGFTATACRSMPDKTTPTTTVPEAAETQEGADTVPTADAVPEPAPEEGKARTRSTSETLYKVPVGNAPVLGPEDALVTVVVFSDYECRFCVRLDATLTELHKEMAEKGTPFRLARKQFPLAMHKNARPAALAALAAGAQGKYWQMHALLAENMHALDAASLKTYAKQLGLNMRQFNSASKRKTFEAHIEADVELGEEVGVKGTPASFVNGRFVSGARPKEDWQALLEEEMAKAQELVNQGTPAAQVYEKILESAKTTDKSDISTPDNAPAKGPDNAPVTIHMWLDFECPFCGQVLPALQALERKYSKKVRFVFRHLPMPFHAHAQKAAEAAMAAHAQGQFWPMYELLLKNPKALDAASLTAHAQKLKLDVEQFQAALDNNTYADYVKNDAAVASEHGIGGTPSFLVNGRLIAGAQPLATFERAVEAALKKIGPQRK